MPERKMRSSQIIVPFGVGAIADFPDESLMTCSIDYWHGGEIIHDDRLQKRLGVGWFRKPPLKEHGYYIPFVRFPRWLFCPSCRDLKPVERWNKEYQERKNKSFIIPQCSICDSKLVPSRFVVACPHGHIDDFPWIEWVHRKERLCNKPELKITTGTGSSGLSGINVKCTKCKASETMNRAFSKGELDKIKKCYGNKPWELGKHEKCDQSLTTLQRGGSNVYFPNLISSIYIPQKNSSLMEIIKKSHGWNALSTAGIEDMDNILEPMAKSISNEINYDIETVKKCLNQLIYNNFNGAEDIGEVLYRYDEYKAFSGELEVDIDSGNFVVETIDSGQYGFNFIDKIILAHKIREIRALLNFTRLKPLDSNEHPDDKDESEEFTDNKIKPQMISNNLNSKGWLPAIETKGEGIFIKFNSNVLKSWCQQEDVLNRANIINERYKKVILEKRGKSRQITPKFILLHTLSHLLIRHLSFEAGYSSASLRERIYCNETENQPSMEGILVYTASGDSDGTLGGLVREGRPDYFPSIVQNCIEKAGWCSSDPLCQDSTGQGLDSLNLSACHACVLLPETSCEERNRFLDRVLLTGKIDNPELGFFNFNKIK